MVVFLCAIQLFDALRDHGDDDLKRLSQATPSKHLHAVHTVYHLSDSTLKVEKHRFQQQLLAVRIQAAVPSSQITVNQAPGENPNELQLAPAATPCPNAP